VLNRDQYGVHIAQLTVSHCVCECVLLRWCSCDELATEAILKSLQVYVGLCGGVNLSTPRDAIIIALCKASLPPHYALHVLTISTDIRGVLQDSCCFTKLIVVMATCTTAVIVCFIVLLAKCVNITID